MIEKFEILANNIIDYSLNINKDDKVLITYDKNVDVEFIKIIIEKILKRGSSCNLKIIDDEIDCFVKSKLNNNQIDLNTNILEHEVNTYTASIRICYNQNDYENKYVDINMYQKMKKQMEKLDDIRINERKWVLLNYPSILDANKAKMTISEFRNYALDVMCYDYKSMQEKMLPLKKLMEKTKKVRLVGKNTDISFSIENMPAIICAGKCNIPDGEIFTAPVKTSVNGIITYNTPSPYQDNVYNNISLEFKDGKIINATADNDVDKLNKILDTDEGSRYIGEFSIGLNPLVKYPMGDILFDEKIKGSIHFTPGMAYKEAFNGNTSIIHWDLVLIQREEYGGGEIYFDDVLIRKDGIFVIKELEALNNL